MAWLDFLAVIFEGLGRGGDQVYLFDFANYTKGSNPLVSAEILLGSDILSFCNKLKTINGFLVFKVMESTPDRSLHNDVRMISEFIRQHCPDVCVITLSTQLPCFFVPTMISLPSLSEAETNRYIDAHFLGGYVTEEEVESNCVYNYTGGAPAAIDSFLRLRQHTDLVEIQLGGLRTISPHLYYPNDLTESISFLEREDPDALELLIVLSAFPMGESIHAVRYIQPKRLLHGKSAIVLEDMGLVYQVSLRSDNIGKFEPNKIVIVHRLVREYIADIFLPKKGDFSRFNYIQAAVSIYFVDWLNDGRKLKGNFLNEKNRLDVVTTGNARSFIIDLMSHAKNVQETDSAVLDKTLSLVGFYVAKLHNSVNYRYVVDVIRDVWSIISELPDKTVIQEIKYIYLMALRMREFYGEALAVAATISIPYSEDFDCRLKTEMAYNYLALNDVKQAKQLADEVRVRDFKAHSLMHAKFIVLRISRAKDKRVKLERLVKESRARGVIRLSNHIKAHLLQSIGDLSQRRVMYKVAAEEALYDGDVLNYVRNTIEYCEAALQNGKALDKSDISSLEDAYRFSCRQRYKNNFQRASRLLWDDNKNKAESDKLLELFCRNSQLLQIMKIDGEEESYLRDLFAVLHLGKSIRQDARLMYVLIRALELEIMPFDSLSSSILVSDGGQVLIPKL
jgi:hypothetical protein